MARRVLLSRQRTGARRPIFMKSNSLMSSNGRRWPAALARGTAGPSSQRPEPHGDHDPSERGSGRRVQIVVTPGSGEGRALASARKIRRALGERGYPVDIRTFAHLDMLSRWAATCEPSFFRLLCVGGDSTQSVAAGAALRLGVPFVPVPNGFGNMFATAFGHGAAPDAVLAVIEGGEIHDVDVGQAADDLFLSHRSYGPLEQIETAVERDRKQLRTRLLRSFAYYTAAARYLATTALPSIHVEVDGVVLAEEASMVTVANVETYRGFLSLTPAATPIDGVFDIVASTCRSKAELLFQLLRRWLGSPWRADDRMPWSCGQRVRISVSGMPAEIVRVLPRALPVVVPPGSVERLKVRQARARAKASTELVRDRTIQPGGERVLPSSGR
jgi:diacylglycerol kinase (ATP)